MTKLDKILDAASITHIEADYPGLHFHEVNTPLVKEQIKALFLELIGEDEPYDQEDGVPRYKDGKDQWGGLYALDINNQVSGRNRLRAELQEKVNEL